MTTTTAKRAAAVEPEPDSQIRVPRVSTIAGFAVDLCEHRFDEADRVPAFTLSSWLKVVCGSASEGGYMLSPVTDERCWRTLRESPEAEVRAAVRRTEKLTEWVLPGEGRLVDRVDMFFGRARARKIVGAA